MLSTYFEKKVSLIYDDFVSLSRVVFTEIEYPNERWI